MFLTITLLAQASASATPKAGPGGITSILFFLPLIALMYVFMIRPQKARQRAHVQMLSAIEVGDEVETAGGMFGKVTRAEDNLMWVELAPGLVVKMSRNAVRRRVVEPDPGQPGS